MLGSIDPRYKEVQIVGGGIAGLLLAYVLDQKGFDVQIFEKEDRIGGLIQTIHTPWGFAESSIHSFLATPEVRKLMNELDLEMIFVRPESKARWIVRNGKMKRNPLNFLETLIAIGRACFVPAVSQSTWENMTVENWSQRHLGDGVTQYFMKPFVHGIYGSEPDELLASMAFPQFKIPSGQTLLTSRFFSKKPKEKKQIQMASLYLGMNSLIYALKKN